jgi:hypothetical protein
LLPVEGQPRSDVLAIASTILTVTITAVEREETTWTCLLCWDKTTNKGSTVSRMMDKQDHQTLQPCCSALLPCFSVVAVVADEQEVVVVAMQTVEVAAEGRCRI